MTELEQLLESALLALMHYPLMSAWEKAQLCDRLERMVYNAGNQFRDQDAREEEAKYEARLQQWREGAEGHMRRLA